MTRSTLLLGIVFSCWLGTPRSAAAADDAVGKVIAVYPDRNTSKFVLETSSGLISGRNVYVGRQFEPVTVGDLLSRSESLYYYAASAPGKVNIGSGDPIHLDRPQPRTLSPASILNFKINEQYTFSGKQQGEITAVQGDHAMIDRGSLHEVRERDLYRIYDSSGHYKGMLELRGIGDLQSSGQLYNAFEDFHGRALNASPGDRVEYAGQRKLFALGLIGGYDAHKSSVDGTFETASGAGLLWDLTFPDGWGVEILFGAYQRHLVPTDSYIFAFNSLVFGETNIHKVTSYTDSFIAPIWLKKNFFYPSTVSPFLAVGAALMQAKYSVSRATPYIDGFGIIASAVTDDSKQVTRPVPTLGAGVEFYPGRFLRPRIEVRYFDSPRISVGSDTFSPKAIYYSVGFLTTW